MAVVINVAWDDDLLHFNFWTHIYLLFILVVRVIAGLWLKRRELDRCVHNKCLNYIVQIVVLFWSNLACILATLWAMAFQPTALESSNVELVTAITISVWNAVILMYFIELYTSQLRPKNLVHHLAVFSMGTMLYLSIIDDPTNVLLWRYEIVLVSTLACH